MKTFKYEMENGEKINGAVTFTEFCSYLLEKFSRGISVFGFEQIPNKNDGSESNGLEKIYCFKHPEKVNTISLHIEAELEWTRDLKDYLSSAFGEGTKKFRKEFSKYPRIGGLESSRHIMKIIISISAGEIETGKYFYLGSKTLKAYQKTNDVFSRVRKTKMYEFPMVDEDWFCLEDLDIITFGFDEMGTDESYDMKSILGSIDAMDNFLYSACKQIKDKSIEDLHGTFGSFQSSFKSKEDFESWTNNMEKYDVVNYILKNNLLSRDKDLKKELLLDLIHFAHLKRDIKMWIYF